MREREQIQQLRERERERERWERERPDETRLVGRLFIRICDDATDMPTDAMYSSEANELREKNRPHIEVIIFFSREKYVYG